MSFTSRRGRPRKVEATMKRQERDLGTAELQAKRAQDLTSEAIDICKKKAIINDEQYHAALHFRWLYTIRFGAPGVSALNLDSQYGREIRNNNDIWQREREMEYSMAIEKLRVEGTLKIVMNIAIFNHLPRFLKNQGDYSYAQLRQNARELDKFKDGLDLLVKLWAINHQYRYKPRL